MFPEYVPYIYLCAFLNLMRRNAEDHVRVSASIVVLDRVPPRVLSGPKKGQGPQSRLLLKSLSVDDGEPIKADPKIIKTLKRSIELKSII